MLELLEDYPNLDMVMAPVGGGGLICGTALASHYLSPKTKIVGAEPSQADDAYRSFQQGKLIPSHDPDTIADGLLASLGDLTFPILLEHGHCKRKRHFHRNAPRLGTHEDCNRSLFRSTTRSSSRKTDRCLRKARRYHFDRWQCRSQLPPLGNSDS